MRMTLYRLNLPLAHEFRISRGAIEVQPCLIVKLEHDGVCGYGEVTENRFYGHTFDSMTASLAKTANLIERYATQSPVGLWNQMYEVVEGDSFALSALDIAAHDLRGKRLGIPTWQDWGLQWADVPQSSYTIGIDSIETMVAKLKEKPGWAIYKIKLGTSQDIAIVKELRRHTDAIFRVDANCAWTAEETITNSFALSELGVQFIEQPLPIGASRSDKQRVFVESALPIIADEDCQQMGDIELCQGLYHGVNVKICKCGGLTPALSMLRAARQLNMKTMVGCMVESSIGISSAAQLLPLLDYADLDGAVLLREEPASGVTILNGVVQQANHPGCGSGLNLNRIDRFLVSSGN